MQTDRFNVTGMSCAACSAHVEKAVKGIEGVKEVAVNLLSGRMNVTYEKPANKDRICEAVVKVGYGIKQDYSELMTNKSGLDKEISKVDKKYLNEILDFYNILNI